MTFLLLFLTYLVASEKPHIVTNPYGDGLRLDPKRPDINDIHYNINEIARLKNQGVDTSNFTVANNHDVPVARAIYNDDYINRWTQTDTDGKIVLAWSVMEGYPYEAETTKYMEQFGRDLGCVKTVKVERSDLSSTKWQQGLMFVWSTHTTGGCWSALGQSDGYSGSTAFGNITETGAPSGWQAIAMDENCGGASAATVMHEALHALGTGHEHNRPDRDTYLHVDTSQSSMPSQYYKLEEQHWLETGQPFELGSVMIYCSMCSATGDEPVATLKNGETYPSGSIMTTTDALQIQYRYCNSREGFVYKEHVTCPNADAVGIQRPIFTDRLCDGTVDCPGMSDEDGTLAPCIPYGDDTDNGCCNSYIFDGLEFTYSGLYNGRDYFTNNGSELHIVYKKRWLVLTSELEATTYSYFDMHASTGNCPPTDSVWEFGGTVACKVAGPSLTNFCQQNDCHENAVCKNRYADYDCICREGYKGDGSQCTKIPVEDECALEKDNCSATGGKCIDEKYGFRCECAIGYVDEAPEQSGTQCVACCKSMEFRQFNALQRTCTFNETLSATNEKYIYDCFLPDKTRDVNRLEYFDYSFMNYQWAVAMTLSTNQVQYVTTTIDADRHAQCLYGSEGWLYNYTVACVEYFVFEDNTDTDGIDGTEGSGTEGSGTEDSGTEGSGTEDSGTEGSGTEGSGEDGTGGSGDTNEITRPFKLKLKVQIKCKLEWNSELENKNSEAYQALYNEIYDWFLSIMGPLLKERGLHLKLILKFKGPEYRIRRANGGSPSLDIDVELTGDSDDVEDVATAAVEINSDIIESIISGVQNYKGGVIDESQGPVIGEMEVIDDCDARSSVPICRLDIMGISVPSCALPNDTFHQPYMGDNKRCLGAVEGKSLVFKSDSNDCRISPTDNGTHLAYRSSVNWEAGSSNAIITRSRSIRIDFECVFETELIISMDGFNAMLDTVEVDLGLANGAYELSLRLWENDTFSTPLPQDTIINVPDKLYVGAVLSDPGIFLTRLEHCWATPSADSENDIRYDFITEGCGNADELAEQTLNVLSNGQAPMSMFVMESFQFKTISNEVYIHCQVHICDPEYENCEPTCAVSRRKRSAPSKVSKLSVGPITVMS